MAERSINEEEGLCGPDSVIWRVDRETVVALAGTCATLMQIAHPAVAAGVRDHSHFDVDLAGRLRRTMDLTMSLVFGTREAALQAARIINVRHRAVRGPGYSALDPELLLWVHATLVYSAIRAYAAFVEPLGDDEADAYYEDAKEIGILLGIPRGTFPRNLIDLRRYIEDMIERGPVEVGQDAREIGLLLLYPNFPRIPQLMFAPIRTLTAGLLPERLRRAYGMNWGALQRSAFRLYCRTIRLALPLVPRAIRFMPFAREAYRRLEPSPGLR